MNILQSAPPEAWFVLFGATIGALSAVLGGWLNNRSNARLLRMQLDHQRDEKAKEDARLQHEALYIECRKYFGDLVCYYLPYQRAMQGDITYNDALDMTNRRGEPRDYDPNHVTMLIDFYFPAFKEDFQKVMAIRDRLNEIMHGFKEQYRTGDTDGGRWLKLFRPDYTALAREMGAFEERVASHRPPV